MRSNARAVLTLGFITLATWIAVDWLRNQPGPVFYPYDAPDLVWYVLGLLLTAGILARLSIPAVPVGRVIVILLAAAPFAIVAAFLIETYIPLSWISYLAIAALCVVLLLYVQRRLRRMNGGMQGRAILIAVLFVAGFAWASNALMVDPSLWSAQTEEPGEEAAPDDAESLLFSQPGLIEAAVARMAPSASDAPGAFFLGFAGYGGQKVFAEEIKLAARTMGARFGSANREVMLLNDRRSLHEAPLASPTALGYALHAIAARMNLRKDVLFLALSSHGSQDGLLAVSNHGLPIDDLDMESLRSALDDSGIVWRVIVISACYSGQFVDPLSSPRTVVITASAGDRTSFGCADDRDLTYFGEAFYRDALPHSRSLRDAFQKARAAIEAREKAEGVEPSHPQAFFGREIEAKLAQLSE